MKKGILLFITLCSLIVVGFNNQTIFAHTEDPVSIRYIKGSGIFGLETQNDKVHLTAENDLVFDFRYVENEAPIKIRISTLYKTFVVKDLYTSNILLTITEFDYIDLDTSRVRDYYVLDISSNKGSFEITQMDNLSIYFTKDTVYEKAVNHLNYESDVDNPINLEDINSQFIVWDNYDGDITSSILIETDNYTENRHIVGEHNVTLKVSDTSNNLTRLTYTINVLDMTAPIIEELSDVYVSYKETYDMNQIINNVTATDNYDDEVSVTIKTENYSLNKDKVGSYLVELEANDNSGNKSTKTLSVNVIDDVKPVISGNNLYTINVSENLSMDDIINNLTVIDEVDVYPINKIIESSNYLQNEIGNYEIVISATDLSGNKETYTIQVNVTDNIAPIFYINLSQINLTNLTHYNEAELLEIVVKKMPFSYEKIKVILNEYLNNEKKPGIYRLQLSAESGNDTTYLQTLIRVTESPIVEQEIVVYWYENPWLLTGISSSLVAAGIAVYFVIKKKRIG